MTVNTKSTNIIPIPQDTAERLLLMSKLEEYFDMLEDALYETLNEKIEQEEWMEVNGGDYYFVPEDDLIIANPAKIQMDAEKFVQLEGLNWGTMKAIVARKWFSAQKDKNPIVTNNAIAYTDTNYNNRTVSYVYCADINNHMQISNASMHSWSMSDTDGIKIPIYELTPSEKEDIFYFLLANNLNLFSDEKLSKLFDLFVSLYQKELMGQDEYDEQFKIYDSDSYDLVCEELKQRNLAFNTKKSKSSKAVLIDDDDFSLAPKTFDDIVNGLLDCDKLRVNMETYPEHILEDPESGHWDLWEDGNSLYTVKILEKLVARNPVYDALENKSGVVGIDFGTKSTVVMYRQSRADILPMRIGSGQFSRVVSQNDYENPTVMELRNVEKFMSDYRQYEGRPQTYWEDVLISHEASEQLKSEQSKGDTFASFFSELKQWASDKSRQVRLRDLQGNEINIPSYLSLSEEDFDPIEIYAYYLGMFINNMVHKIYLRYKLSFPATVEKQVRDKILDSFTKGIKKSLPVQVLKDDNCMSIFKVEQGASEPAAYAITALNGYGFDPEDNQKYYYGIFDFGGGTTDFDFGVWSAEETEPENYDYQISHFGQGGDPYLGGENLLEILSYHVFLRNYDKLLKDKIVFIRPFGEKEIAGKDYLIAQDSQYAHFNQKRMMEKLRGVWEGEEETRESVRAGSITLPLFTMDGDSKDNYSLEVDLEELDQLLEHRIDKGISQFFDALKNCFGVKKNEKDVHDVDNIHIFLAGNSSKSPIVYKIFKKYIDIHTDALAKREGGEEEWFKIYPPLGTDLSNEIIKGNLQPLIDDIVSYLDKNVQKDKDATGKSGANKTSIVADQNKDEEKIKEAETPDDENTDTEFNIRDLNKPTGKTGVAYGLLNNRVRVVQNESEEIGFRYYIGQNRKNKFYCIIDKDLQKYNAWTRFCTASREDFDIWFTRAATAPSNKMPIDQIGVYSETGFVSDPTPEKSVFIRLVSPTEIEYVVADEEEINSSSYEEDQIQRVSLQEKQ